MGGITTQCIFQFEAKTDQPCWGEELFYDETASGDKLITCEGHADWSLSESVEFNRSRYIKQKEGRK
jgi:hypothetical protein